MTRKCHSLFHFHIIKHLHADTSHLHLASLHFCSLHPFLPGIQWIAYGILKASLAFPPLKQIFLT